MPRRTAASCGPGNLFRTLVPLLSSRSWRSRRGSPLAIILTRFFRSFVSFLKTCLLCALTLLQPGCSPRELSAAVRCRKEAMRRGKWSAREKGREMTMPVECYRWFLPCLAPIGEASVQFFGGTKLHRPAMGAGSGLAGGWPGWAMAGLAAGQPSAPPIVWLGGVELRGGRVLSRFARRTDGLE